MTESTATPSPLTVLRSPNGHVEWHPGTVPIVICVPHDGQQEADHLPDRPRGVHEPDRNTRAAALAISESFRNSRKIAAFFFGEAVTDQQQAVPHLIISNLPRSKLDPNRSIGEAAQGLPDASRAWYAYHSYIERAKQLAYRQTLSLCSASPAARLHLARGIGPCWPPRVLLIDLHGQSHPEDWLEVGYCIPAHGLRDIRQASLTAATPEASPFRLYHLLDIVRNTSVRAAIEDECLATAIETIIDRNHHSDLCPESVQATAKRIWCLLGGCRSLGSHIAARGWRAVPSLEDALPFGKAPAKTGAGVEPATPPAMTVAMGPAGLSPSDPPLPGVPCMSGGTPTTTCNYFFGGYTSIRHGSMSSPSRASRCSFSRPGLDGLPQQPLAEGEAIDRSHNISCVSVCDAYQVELSPRCRDPSNIANFSRDFSFAVAEFYAKNYLSPSFNLVDEKCRCPTGGPEPVTGQ
ncbi:hypothetical protein H696_02080 [Fonticula alba]|uniref:N-formylglutamate amidohydrolase n=1 Tax=Fonticula alba TaxID=691883 RepID=A0A058ZA07_FONAL|nr:hypothetical protein H696_02080 [Fonticula alba]KCV71129.1 hypothetical protein H696_02080 [Fonticula alba]|eukprot:XP_009494252.1 hypothetical protein H696_02080 [Fonticula alba]